MNGLENRFYMQTFVSFVFFALWLPTKVNLKGPLENRIGQSIKNYSSLVEFRNLMSGQQVWENRLVGREKIDLW